MEISICIPVHNGADFLRAAIDSALAQTRPAVEIVIVDDCSTDESCHIVESFGPTTPPIRLHRNPSRLGLVGNWNRSVELAQGRWIKFLFQDDLLEPTCLEVLGTGTLDSGASLGIAARGVMGDGPPAMLRALRQRTLARRLRSPAFVTPAELSRLAARRPGTNILGEPSAALIDRAAFESHGMFDPSYKQLCDWEFWLRVGTTDGLWFETSELSTFRVHDGSTSTRNREAGSCTTLHDAIRLETQLLVHPHFASFRSTAPTASVRRRLRRHLVRSSRVCQEPLMQTDDQIHADVAGLGLDAPAGPMTRLGESIRHVLDRTPPPLR